MSDPHTQAYFRLGSELKPAMLAMLEGMVRELQPQDAARRTMVFFGSYWGAEPGILGQYNFLFPDERLMHQVGPRQPEFCRRAEEALRVADGANACHTHRVGCAFYHAGMKDLPPLYRED